MAVLIGWRYGWTVLKGAGTGLVIMQPNAALDLMLGSIALLCLHLEAPGRRRTLLGLAASALAWSIGVATLIEYGWEGDPGIDRVLFGLILGPIDPAVLSRMAVMTAVSLSGLGPALALLRSRGRAGRWASQGFALVPTMRSTPTIASGSPAPSPGPWRGAKITRSSTD